jgi:hypothetical protein
MNLRRIAFCISIFFYSSVALADAAAVEDNRAMLREGWAEWVSVIQAIEIGYKCGFILGPLANAAQMKIRMIMVNELSKLGLSGDPTMNPVDYVNRAIVSGEKAATEDACTRITPADRARLRLYVSEITTQFH